MTTANVMCGLEHSMSAICVKATKRSIVDFHDMENQSYVTHFAVEDFEELAGEIENLKFGAEDKDNKAAEGSESDGGVDKVDGGEGEVSKYHTDTDEYW